MYLLECHNICKNFGEKQVLKGLSFNLQNKEFLSLLGPSGNGKSTLLNIISGLENYDSGEVRLNGKLLANGKKVLSPFDRSVGLVFQDVALFPHLTVAQNIAFGLQNKSRSKTTARVEELLNLIKLTGYNNKMPHEISGGEQQRVALARALAPKPDLILLDEPFSSLDFQLRVQVRRELHQVLKAAGVSVILVTHDQTEAFSFAERVILMQEGRIVQEGEAKTLYQLPNSPWVANFVGKSNFFTRGELSFLLHEKIDKFDIKDTDQIMVRPEEFLLEAKIAEDKVNAVVTNMEFAGNHMDIELELLNKSKAIHLMVDPQVILKIGQRVKVTAKRFRVWSEYQGRNHTTSAIFRSIDNECVSRRA